MLYDTFATTLIRLKSRFSSQVYAQTQALPCNTRHHLAHRIETELNNPPCDDTQLLQELDSTIRETQNGIRRMEESEQLLYMKINTYQNTLDSYREKKQASSNGTDATSTYHGDMEKVIAYEAELKKIQHVHREILIGLEQSRRKLKRLQLGMEDYVEQSQECMEFLLTSAELDRCQGDHVEELKELEICALNKSGRDRSDSLTMTSASENVV